MGMGRAQPRPIPGCTLEVFRVQSIRAAIGMCGYPAQCPHVIIDRLWCLALEFQCSKMFRVQCVKTGLALGSTPEIVAHMKVRKARAEDHQTLLDIWEQSVRASHDFLSEQDIQSLIPVVRDQALASLEVWVLCDESLAPIGFMGLDNNRLEALFIVPTSIRQGGGRLMLEHARKLKGSLYVDVNEQNPRAVACYLANGFVVSGRSPIDGQGQPFPLLHLTEGGHGAPYG